MKNAHNSLFGSPHVFSVLDAREAYSAVRLYFHFEYLFADGGMRKSGSAPRPARVGPATVTDA
jgi:hypothetical protein